MLGANVCVRMDGENSKCQNSCKHTYARSMERKCSEIFWGRIQRNVTRHWNAQRVDNVNSAFWGESYRTIIYFLVKRYLNLNFFFMHKFVSSATASLAVVIMLDSQVLCTMCIYIAKNTSDYDNFSYFLYIFWRRKSKYPYLGARH